MMPLGLLRAENKDDLTITKYHIHKINNKKLTISEIFSFNLALSLDSKIFEIKTYYIKRK